MPGYSKADNILGCKIVTSFPNNVNIGMSSIFATILLFEPETGKPKVIVDGRQITGWRTAAASAVVTKYMHREEKKILSIIGAGVQAESHTMVFQHLFKFPEVRIWNRTKENAKNLVSKLSFEAKIFDSIEECCKDADVICTTTYSSEPLVKWSWLKPGVHINAVGAGVNHYSELEEDIYRNSYLAVEHQESAEKELKGLLDNGISIKCEVGEFIAKGYKLPQGSSSVFQSMGLAIEDVAAANLVYKKYTEKNNPSTM